MKGNFNLTASIAEKGPSITNFISKIIKDGVSMQDIDEYLNILSHQDIKKMNIRGFDLEYKRNRIASFNVVKSKITDFKLVIFPQSLLDGLSNELGNYELSRHFNITKIGTLFTDQDILEGFNLGKDFSRPISWKKAHNSHCLCDDSTETGFSIRLDLAELVAWLFYPSRDGFITEKSLKGAGYKCSENRICCSSLKQAKTIAEELYPKYFKMLEEFDKTANIACENLAERDDNPNRNLYWITAARWHREFTDDEMSVSFVQPNFEGEMSEEPSEFPIVKDESGKVGFIRKINSLYYTDKDGNKYGKVTKWDEYYAEVFLQTNGDRPDSGVEHKWIIKRRRPLGEGSVAGMASYYYPAITKEFSRLKDAKAWIIANVTDELGYKGPNTMKNYVDIKLSIDITPDQTGLYRLDL